MSFLREPNVEPLPGYRLIEPIGNGGFGEVWKCEAPGGLFKAMKFVFGNLNANDNAARKAEQELKALNWIKEVRHPFILSLERLEVVKGELVIVMELADKSLHDCLLECRTAGRRGLPREVLLRYLRDTAEALDHMNEKHNLQHLDVKPRNLFLVSDRVKVADFGLVQHVERTSDNGLMGAVTPLYGAPETYSGKIAATTDQYSLAIVYYELLTGERPFDGKTPRQLAQQHMQGEPDLRALSEVERAIVAKALSKDPQQRYTNCMGFVRALHSSSTSSRASLFVSGGRNSHPSLAEDDFDALQFGEISEPDEVGFNPDEEVDLTGPTPLLHGREDVEPCLGMTVAQPELGSLRPTLIIGMGTFGRQALLELRCRLLDRFGDLNKLLLLRFLYLEIDSESAQKSLRGNTAISLKPADIVQMPLQPTAHYRRRQMEQIDDWLPREKLHAMPRSLKPQGSRALGRLAFVGSYLKIRSRLKAEIQQITHPDIIFQTVNHTGLSLRNNTPRVYLIASASGASSGYIIDLAYTLRRLFEQMRMPDASITSLLFCGAPDDPAVSEKEQANVVATIAEINHYQDSTVTFTAQYGTDGPKLQDSNPPFHTTYLLSIPNQTPEARRDALSHLGAYLVNEITTPLGLRLENARMVVEGDGVTSFRGFGTYGIWFPRGLVLRLAARQVSLRLLNDWQSNKEPQVRDEIQSVCVHAENDPALQEEVLKAELFGEIRTTLGGKPEDVLHHLLSELEKRCGHPQVLKNPKQWVNEAVTQIKDWFGSSLKSDRGEIRSACSQKSRFGRALDRAILKLAEQAAHRLTQATDELTALPGRRLAASEEALKQLCRFFENKGHALCGLLETQTRLVQQTQLQFETALSGFLDSSLRGWFPFGSGTARRLRGIVHLLGNFARRYLAEEMLTALQCFYSALAGKLRDRLGDLAVCRQRLRSLKESIESGTLDIERTSDSGVGRLEDESLTPLNATTFWENVQQSRTSRIVLPDDEKHLERAAKNFVDSLTPDHWVYLDQCVQDQLLSSHGGLPKTCLGNSSITHNLAIPLLDCLSAILENYLPMMDVAEVVCGVENISEETVQGQLEKYHLRSAPLVSGDSPFGEFSFLLTPTSDAGKWIGEQAKSRMRGIQIVSGPAQTDLLFVREQGNLTLCSLQELLNPLREAYQESTANTQSSPHSRFDVLDWIPLDAYTRDRV